jgi:hypothetical protein
MVRTKEEQAKTMSKQYYLEIIGCKTRKMLQGKL